MLEECIKAKAQLEGAGSRVALRTVPMWSRLRKVYVA